MLSAAEAHYRSQQRFGAAAALAARRAWDAVPLGDLDSWAPLRLAGTLSALQVVAAREADRYVTAALVEQAIDPTAVAAVAAGGFSGVSGDGRPLVSLLDQPRITAKTAIGAGVGAAQAWEQARSSLSLMSVTALQDAGRGAVSVAMQARPAVTGYVRMLNPPSCSRCAVLAGRKYRKNTGLPRHPRCDCKYVPVSEDTGDDLVTNPNTYFESLSRAEQDRIFTGAGAKAIRDGADIGQVVNARSGMTTAGTTTVGTTRRGVAGAARRAAGARGPRLMPESIYRIAGDDSAEALRLLRINGYLT